MDGKLSVIRDRASENWFLPNPLATKQTSLAGHKNGCWRQGLSWPDHLDAGCQDPDLPLVLRARQGEVAAFEALVEKHKQPLLNYITRTLQDSTEAEDVAQNAFVRVFKALDRFRLTARFSTWLFAIARNLCLNELRRRSRHSTCSLDADEHARPDLWRDLWEESHGAGSAAEALVDKELRDKTEQALAELPEPQRTAILLLREDELSYEQIAQVLKRSVSSTRTIIHRGRQRLKARLMPYLRNGHWRAAQRGNPKCSPGASVVATRKKVDRLLLSERPAKQAFWRQPWGAMRQTVDA